MIIFAALVCGAAGGLAAAAGVAAALLHRHTRKGDRQ